MSSVFKEINKLTTINRIQLPDNFLNDIPQKMLNKYKLRVASESLSELKRHEDYIKHPLLSIYFWLRRREVTDNLIDLLLHIIHKINVRAESRVEKQFIKEFKKVSGKHNLLYRIAEKSLDNPQGIIQDIIYPVADKDTLENLVKEFKNTGATYKEKVHTIMRGSYARHYRRMVPEILNTLQFNSNNDIHRPVILALELLKENLDSTSKYFYLENDIPIDGVIRPYWQEAVIEKDKRGKEKINRINYEMCTLEALRDRLRCKEIWVSGANRYRNPDEDLPLDFEVKRNEYYKALNLPMSPDRFISMLKKEMKRALKKLNKNMPNNPKVSIKKKKGGWISVSKYEKQLEPNNIQKLKREIMKRWSMTGLLDIIKETDLRLSFTDAFKTMASSERLDRTTIQKRLILALYGLGSNTGLKRVAIATDQDEKELDLFYIKRKFINKDNLRNAIRIIINGILKSRLQNIWGDATTSCASDSKKFGSWDQNLMTEWHARYRGPGVMIYWHVEKKSICIYSQLKTCSSSEVASMIEGVIRHCTDMSIEKNYVDTHGQSEVAFAFSHLLGFQLMPRIKNIHSQKLYRPDTQTYSNLKPVVTKKIINWDLIKEQYDQMIKYATAIRIGTAETEAILTRFTKNSLKHPTYLAFSELGKVIKTIFLCEYLISEEMRIEINEGLNVIENWNSANAFIFFGKGGEVSTNNIEAQELSLLSLHLLQNCLIYINTLMIQDILSESEWYNIMTPEDFRALTPLIYQHVNPYGIFQLDMKVHMVFKCDTK